MDPTDASSASSQKWKQYEEQQRINRKPLAPSPSTSVSAGSLQTTPGSAWTPTFSAFTPDLTSPAPTSHRHESHSSRRGGGGSILKSPSQSYRSQTYELQLQDKRNRPSLGRDGSYHSHAASVDSGLRHSQSHSRNASGSTLLSPESSFSFGGEDVPLNDTDSRSVTSTTNLLKSPSSRGHQRGPSASSELPPKPPSLLRRIKAVIPPSWSMLLFLALGIIGAASHHVFYATLDGREAEDQLQMLRYGTVLSFLTKAALVAAVLLAFRQRVWYSVRQGLFSVRALDALFAATDDLTAVWNREVFMKAKVAMVLALFVWSTPLVVILTSNTLTVQLSMLTETTKCRSVRTLNFTHEETENWRAATQINGLFGISTTWWNNTDSDITAPHFFDYYDQPSDQWLQYPGIAMFLRRPVTRDGASDDICGRGWNCSYIVNFTAPGYRCEQLAEGPGVAPARMRNGATPPRDLNTSALLPEGDLNYLAIVDRGDYVIRQVPSEELGGIPISNPPFPPHLGAFRTEPVLWIGYSTPIDPAAPLPANRSVPGWDKAFIPRIFGCEHYYTRYSVLFNHTAGGTQTTTVISREFERPVVDTVFQPGENANDGTGDNTTAIPQTNYILPQTDVGLYRRTAAYHSIGAALRKNLGGRQNASNTAAVVTQSKATQTRLIDSKNFPIPDLMANVQSFYEDLVLSMFANPQFLAVSWAAKPWEKSGKVVGDESTGYPCEKSKRANLYHYVRRDLWLVYGFAVALGCVAVGLGFASMVGDAGELRGMRFSDIVVATRGRGLDGLVVGKDGVMLGYGLVPKDGAGGMVGVGGGGGGGVGREDGALGLRWERRDAMPGFGVEGEVQQQRVRKRGNVIFSALDK